MGAAIGIGVRRERASIASKSFPSVKGSPRSARVRAGIVTLGASATLTGFGLTRRRHYGLRRCIRRGQALCRSARA